MFGCGQGLLGLRALSLSLRVTHTGLGSLGAFHQRFIECGDGHFTGHGNLSPTATRLMISQNLIQLRAGILGNHHSEKELADGCAGLRLPAFAQFGIRQVGETREAGKNPIGGGGWCRRAFKFAEKFH